MSDQSGDKSIRVSMPRDAMEASLLLLACEPEDIPGVDACLAALRDREVLVDDEIESRVRALIERHAEDPTSDHEEVVSRGVDAVHGENGWFELSPELAAPLPPAPEPSDEDERVDFHNRQAFRLIAAGQRLGVVHPPTTGRAGRTVQGKPVNARTGRECDLKTDHTVEIRDGEVIALVPGALRFDDHAISVMETLEISSGVDFSTGNVRFPGDVVVREHVRDCFRIEAAGDVTVRGTVEAAHIEAGRDAHLLGGMAGREKGTMVVGRDLTARYLGMVAGLVTRDAAVEREVVDCDLDVRGRFFGERCVIVGGRLSVMGACEVGEIGRDSGVRTEVLLGRTPAADRIEMRIASLVNTIDSRRKRIAESGANEEEHDLEMMRRRLREASERMRRSMAPFIHTHLTVNRFVHAGAVVYAGDYEMRFTKAVRGPIRLTLDVGGRPHVVEAASGRALEPSSFARVRDLREPEQEADEAA